MCRRRGRKRAGESPSLDEQALDHLMILPDDAILICIIELDRHALQRSIDHVGDVEYPASVRRDERGEHPEAAARDDGCAHCGIIAQAIRVFNIILKTGIWMDLGK